MCRDSTAREPFTSDTLATRVEAVCDTLTDAMTVLAHRSPGSRASLKFTERTVRLMRELRATVEEMRQYGY